MVRLALVLSTAAVAAALAAAPQRDPALAALTRVDAVPTVVSRHTARGVWCSAETALDRRAIEPGPTIHLVYALPFDAPGALDVVGPRVDAAVRSIEAWWRREDPQRVPRFDRYRASCGAQLDVTTVRLDPPTRWFERRAETAPAIVAGVAARGLVAEYVATLILFDGPGGPRDACGQGGTVSDGGRVGVVFLDACPDLPADTQLAHELLHALGALPPGAAHPCPGDARHPCDDAADVLAPTTDGRPLAALRLDGAGDDYYDHAGRWPDVRDTVFLRRLDERRAGLVVRVRGRGTVSSPVPGVACTTACTTSWDVKLQVPLDARPGRGHRFVRWEGACTGTRSCAVRPASAPARVTAVFAPPTFRFRVVVEGRGTVRVGDRSICRSSCVRGVPSYRALRLDAEPAPGWRLSGWSPPCARATARCSVAVEGPMSVRVRFVQG